MKHFSSKFSLAFALVIGLFAFNACQKDEINASQKTLALNLGNVTDRSPEHFTYGVTVFDGINPCEIVEIEEGTGNVTNHFQAYVDNGGGPIFLPDLKGIARTSWGQFFITTGSNNPAPYADALLKVSVVPLPGGGNPGQCSYFGSNSPFGSISDLEFDPISQNFFGLLDNSNQLVEINGVNWVNYVAPVAITGIAPGTNLKGFSIVRDGVFGLYFVGCANRAGAAGVPTTLYTIPQNGGLAAFMTELDPPAELAAGHCGIGFDINLNHLVVNRRTNILGLADGLNALNPWAPPFGAVTPTAPWGTQGFDFEDLSSSVY